MFNQVGNTEPFRARLPGLAAMGVSAAGRGSASGTPSPSPSPSGAGWAEHEGLDMSSGVFLRRGAVRVHAGPGSECSVAVEQRTYAHRSRLQLLVTEFDVDARACRRRNDDATKLALRLLAGAGADPLLEPADFTWSKQPSLTGAGVAATSAFAGKTKVAEAGGRLVGVALATAAPTSGGVSIAVSPGERSTHAFPTAFASDVDEIIPPSKRCSVPDAAKEECGVPGITAASCVACDAAGKDPARCKAVGCCFDERSALTDGIPWCYFSGQNHSQPAPPSSLPRLISNATAALTEALRLGPAALLAEHTAAVRSDHAARIEVEGDLQLARLVNATAYALSASLNKHVLWSTSPGGLSTGGRFTADGHDTKGGPGYPEGGSSCKSHVLPPACFVFRCPLTYAAFRLWARVLGRGRLDAAGNAPAPA